MVMGVASSRHGKRPDCHYCFALFQGLHRARRRCGRGRFASLIPVGLAPDIPFTRPWAAMPPTAAPRPRFRKTWMERFSKQLPQATKKRPVNTPRSLKNVRATETATDVSILPREMSRSDRGVRNREALSDCPELLPQAKKRDRGTLLDLLITCERRDSNPYARRHQILSLAWLPITTRSQIPSGRLITLSPSLNTTWLEAVAFCVRKGMQR